MSDGPDLVSLLYHADWTRLSLTAEVGVTRDRDLWRSRFDGEPPPRAWSGGPFGPWSVPWFAPWSGPRSGRGPGRSSTLSGRREGWGTQECPASRGSHRRKRR